MKMRIHSHGNRNKKEVAITFDDGPAEETLAVLDVLKKHDVKATFFLVGKMIAGREGTISIAQKNGHEFGNHTFSHPSLLLKSKKYIESEITACDDALSKVGIVTQFFRFPYLRYGFNALSVCKKLEKIIISADMISLRQGSYDWFYPWLVKQGFAKSAVRIEKVIERTIQNTRNGSILVFHDYLQGIGSHPELVPILDRVLPELKKRGFRFVTVSELIKN
jgi:peptidoglycan/xylan/chitin deacetylase (PgdA/CDA1 family)